MSIKDWIVLVVGVSVGYLICHAISSPTREELIKLQGAVEKAQSEVKGQEDKLKELSQFSQRTIKALQERLERARSAVEVRYEKEIQVVNRIPSDLVCFGPDEFRVLESAGQATGIGLAASLDTRGVTDRPSEFAITQRDTAEWVSLARREHELCRESLRSVKEWAESNEGICGCLKIDRAK